MKRLLASLFLALAAAAGLAAVAGPALAEDTGLVPLRTLDDSRGWEAVGRLDIGGRAFCTGALVGVDLVLTAAHCLYDRETGERVDAGEIEFLAGFRNGQAIAYRGVSRAVLHPGYAYGTEPGADRVRNDLALLQLRQPIRNTRVRPFGIGGKTGPGTVVGVVSYAHDRAEAPALQESCRVLEALDGVLVLSCAVDFGSSGAPIFAFDGGAPRIVSVVSAKAQMAERPVALGSALGVPLSELHAAFLAAPALDDDGPRVRRMEAPGAAPGAKFIRP